MLKPHLSLAHWIERHPVVANAVMVTGLSLLTVTMMASMGFSGVVGAVLLAAPTYLRIRTPATAAVLMAVAAVIATMVVHTWPITVGLWSVPLVIHKVASQCTSRVRLGILALALGTALFITVNSPYWVVPLFAPIDGFSYGDIQWWSTLIILTPLMWLTIVTAYLFGDLKRVERQRQATEQEQQVRLAAQDERTRIAREMHDVVAHSLSVVITQADGARYASAADPQTAVNALERISTTARDSLQEMRRLLGVLRTDEGTQTTPVPGIDQLPALVEGIRQSGLPVELHRTQTDHHTAALSPGVSLSIYRMVQEALTNVLKHCPDATYAMVTIRTDEDGVEVHVRNDGVQAGASTYNTAPIPSSGYGLRGLAERFRMYGGQLQAGPLPNAPNQWGVTGWIGTDPI
ncbi:MAG: histidine kinase [Kocuria sp.]|nr:histidine kinase [Kocuria sp.]